MSLCFVRVMTAAVLGLCAVSAAEYRGHVTFNGLPVPGVAVAASRDNQTRNAITDQDGNYSFADIAEGNWSIEVKMFGFAPLHQDVVVASETAAGKWELKILPIDQIKADIQLAAKPSPTTPAPARSETAEVPPQRPAPAPNSDDDDLSRRAADGFLINGSTNNGASSPFAQSAAFGNYRMRGRGLYNGGIGLIFDNSAFDAKPFSLTGQDTPKASYNRLTGIVNFGGPIQIPRWFKNGPMLFFGYQWTRNSNSNIASALVPNAAERNGVLPGLVIPPSSISPQARALLNLYPLPNFANNPLYNYQVALLSPTHQDAMQSRLNKTVSRKDQVYGGFAFQSTRSDNPTLFGFLDKTDSLGINTNANWTHRFSQGLFLTLGFQFSRLATHITPNFENRENVSGEAGISGNDQDPANWGPPTLNFANGIATLTDAQSSFNRSQTSGLSYSMLWTHGTHNMTFGTDFRRQEFNYLSQQDPRGTFTFTGAATGSAFGDFLTGIPDTSSIAFGNADKYFRESVYDAFFTDDWRINASLTINAGMRWEYGAPITELYNRIVNLDVAAGFGAIAPVVAANPVGSVTASHYPSSLIQPDKNGYEPRIGIAWRPIAGSSMIVRAGYGLYRDSSVYQTIALQMAQQPPLSKSFSVQNSASTPLTLANGLNAPSLNTFGIDPNFRIGYAQNWQVSVQRDLPKSLQMTATYLGIKGTRGVQEFLPNTYPIGVSTPCLACPTGFAYIVSNGNSTREAATLQLRRRLRSGLTANVLYTYSKSIDDDAVLGGQGVATSGKSLAIAQNWLDLSGERGLSLFDQRHLLSFQGQYTSGMGLAGGTLLNGWRGTLLKDWTVSTQINAGSGLPQTPVYVAPVQGTGFTGTIRPDYTGAPLYNAPSGLFLNSAAYVAPSGHWGNAARNSITGPAQFTLNASLGRIFRMTDKLNLEVRLDSTNALNHVNYTAWNTIINSDLFGFPAAANVMRAVQTTVRVRF